MPLDNLLSALVMLFLVVDPLGLAPTFLSVTEGPAARRQVAARASLIAALVLTGAAVGGDWLFKALGITLPAFRIAGGLLLFSIASEMCSACASCGSRRRPSKLLRSMCGTSRSSRSPFR